MIGRIVNRVLEAARHNQVIVPIVTVNVPGSPFGLINSPEEIPKLKGLRGSTENRSPCRARLSPSQECTREENTEKGRSICLVIDGKPLKELVMFYIYPRLHRCDNDKTRQDRANFPTHPQIVPSKLNFCRIVSKGVTPHTPTGRVSEIDLSQ